MTNPHYNITIAYHPSTATTQQLVNIGGVTYSTPTYTTEYFVASMHEVRLYATGSSYKNALDNLLITASNSVDPGYAPLSQTNNQ